MYLRRCATALAAVTALSASVAPAALADASPSPSPSGSLPAGLFGTADPQYDGVWRQSIALLAQDAAGYVPADSAVEWLTSQQCDDGSFMSYRTDVRASCAKTGPADTNATGMAVQALAAVRGADSEPVKDAVAWLESVQNTDGGWGYGPDDPTDANSTAVVIGALDAAGLNPEDVRRSIADPPSNALNRLQLDCSAPSGKAGGFSYQRGKRGELVANPHASAAATLAAYRKGLAVEPAEGNAGKPVLPDCGETGHFEIGVSPQAAAAQLSSELTRNGGYLTVVMPGTDPQPDHGATALAVIALSAAGYPDAAEEPLNWLAEHHTEWQGLSGQPAGLGQLLLAVRAAGGDPEDFGGTDLVAQLNATGPEPRLIEDSNTVWWAIGTGLVVGAGLGVLVVVLRRRRGDGGAGDGAPAEGNAG
ncbi:terpene cyclase/mutase family protein [Streptomyces sp. JJ38]|nr:terpene cyclase/mutase family protein [Streptomyces sp. JJ38]